MTPSQFKSIRLSLGLSTKQMADALRLSSDKTIRRIEYGEIAISGPVSLLMELFEQYGTVELDDLNNYFAMLYHED